MNVFYKKYLLLAVIGALIIGIGSYLFLSKYLDRQEIIVASKDIKKGEKIEDSSLIFRQYLKSSIPEGYIVDKSKLVGKIIRIDRKKNDPISMEMFSDSTVVNKVDSIKPGEILIAIDLKYFEPLADDLKEGCMISIISTQRDKELMDQINSYQILKNQITENQLQNNIIQGSAEKNAAGNDFLDDNSYKLSDKIFMEEGQIIIRNLEVVSIRKITDKESNVLISSNKSNSCIYIICSIKEAPFVSFITKEDKFKLVVEKI